MRDLFERISRNKLIPLVSIDDAEDAAPLGDALLAGGLPIIEITFRTSAAESAIRSLAARGDLVVGAGTVLNVKMAQRARDAGAAFAVSPGLNPKVVEWCKENRLPLIAGAVTPTEIETALELGIRIVKFFPSEPMGGIKTLQLLRGPYPMIGFIPTGGVGPDNLQSYLRTSNVFACGGSWMAPREMVKAREFDKITELVRSAVDLVAKTSK